MAFYIEHVTYLSLLWIAINFINLGINTLSKSLNSEKVMHPILSKLNTNNPNILDADWSKLLHSFTNERKWAFPAFVMFIQIFKNWTRVYTTASSPHSRIKSFYCNLLIICSKNFILYMKNVYWHWNPWWW